MLPYYSDENDAGSKKFTLPPQLVGEGLPELDFKGAVVAKGELKTQTTGG